MIISGKLLAASAICRALIPPADDGVFSGRRGRNPITSTARTSCASAEREEEAETIAAHGIGQSASVAPDRAQSAARRVHRAEV